MILELVDEGRIELEVSTEIEDRDIFSSSSSSSSASPSSPIPTFGSPGGGGGAKPGASDPEKRDTIIASPAESNHTGRTVACPCLSVVDVCEIAPALPVTPVSVVVLYTFEAVGEGVKVIDVMDEILAGADDERDDVRVLIEEAGVVGGTLTTGLRSSVRLISGIAS